MASSEHAHHHSHEHPHSHPEEAMSGKSIEGSVVLDIGTDVGAVVVFTPEHLLGSEIEIRPAGGQWNGTHTGVRERQMGSDIRFAGVFGALPEGAYDLRVRFVDDGDVHNVEVVGGKVLQTTWPVDKRAK